MATGKQLFDREFGTYFASVSAENPVGVCTDCLMVRSRTEIDPSKSPLANPKELCPVSLMQSGLDNAEQAKPHAWKGFTDRAELEAFVKANFAQFKQVADQAAALAG